MSAHHMTPIDVLKAFKDVMLAAAPGAGDDSGHVGAVEEVVRGWKLAVFFDHANPIPQDGEIEWDMQVALTLVRNDDSADTASGATELERAWAAYIPMYLAVYKLVGGTSSRREGTAFEGKHVVILWPQSPNLQGIQVDGLDDGDKRVAIGARVRVKCREAAPA